MGALFTSIAIKTDKREKVKELLSKDKHTAYLSPASKGWVIIYDKKAEDDDQHGTDLCRSFSKTFKTPVFWFAVDDSDFLWYDLYFNGYLRDAYVGGVTKFLKSYPEAGKGNPRTDTHEKFIANFKGRPEVIAKLFSKRGFIPIPSSEEKQLLDKIKLILNGNYTFAEERLLELAALLEIPDYVQQGYEYLQEEGEDMLGSDFENFAHIKGKE